MVISVTFNKTPNKRTETKDDFGREDNEFDARCEGKTLEGESRRQGEKERRRSVVTQGKRKLRERHTAKKWDKGVSGHRERRKP